MEIVPYTPALLPSITALVNAHIAQIPPGWTVTEEQVAATLAGARALWSLHYPENGEAWEQATLCALDRGQLAAAAQWIYPANGVNTRARADPLIGTESWVFAQSGQVDALHPLPVLPPAELPGIQLDWHKDPQALEWELAARGEALVGECQAWGVPPHFAGCPGVAEWMTIEWLGVEEPYRRKGFGRWLLLEQMRRQAQRGIRRFICWTGVDNQAARHLYESLGFRAGPECYVYDLTNQ